MSRVDPIVVVVPDLPVDRFDEFADVFKPSRIAKLKFEVGVERLLVSVLPWAGLPALRCLGSVFGEQRFVRACDVFTSLVGVEPVRRRLCSPRRVFKCFDHERGCVVVRNMPAQYFARADINDRGEIPEPVLEPEIGEIARPDDVWSAMGRLSLICWECAFPGGFGHRASPGGIRGGFSDEDQMRS